MSEPSQRWSGSFLDEALEREFQREHFELSVRASTRFSLGLSTLSMLAYGLHDALVLPTAREAAWVVRYGFFLPVAAAVMALTFSRWFARWHAWITLLFGLACNATVLAIASVATPERHVLYASYAALFTTLGPFIGRLDPRTQAIYTASTGVLYVALSRAFLRAEPAVGGALLATTLAMGGLSALVAREQGLQARALFVQRREIRAQAEALAVERARSERLLLNVLPAPVAERLKAEERPIADGFSDVTVVFADVVGFTPMTARLTPDEVVRRLDEIFTACDARAAAAGIEKIKTIGDAYMAVGGLDARSAGDHCRRVVEFALGVLEEVEAFNRAHGESLSVRVGVHTGPVVAGVIGTSKFAYDVWGDTVNTASRMESHGVAGAVQVSEVTWARVREMFEFEPRGEIEVKGKGAMRTFTVRPSGAARTLLTR
ncbi:MAG: adenylate/guanylate cyclase domain-containing protein [Polyangiales bacterium]